MLLSCFLKPGVEVYSIGLIFCEAYMVSVTRPLPSVSIYSFGRPIETGAFVDGTRSWKWEKGELPQAWSVTADKDKGFTITLPLNSEDSIVGLGQHVGGVNCRGSIFKIFSTDCPVHIPSLRAMYGAHPFMIVLGKRPFGIFIDAPGEVSVDAGASERGVLSIKVANAGFYLSIISGDTAEEIVSSFLAVVGAPFIPPRWAFGYQQSRWSYEDENSVREIAAKMEEHKIPCDVIHMDIHYMRDYKVFTVDERRFPNLPKLSADLREKGIRLISIIDPGVKVEDGYSVYEEGKERGYFCQRTDRQGPFVGAVWPGPSVFPDFFRADVREWWGGLYKQLQSQGFAGFWNDMNEPSIFYTPQAFKDYAGKVRRFDEQNEFSEALANLIWDKGLTNQESYYDEFLHEINGDLVPNREAHNLFGTEMTRATAQALQSEDQTKRYFLLSRSSYPGMHRYAAIWTGDNHSWWEHLSLNIQMLISLNLTGFMFCGADTGGFGGDCTPEMLIRWTQLGAFSPFFRNHAAMWARNQEPWVFDDETLQHSRAAIQMRYALLPYIYGEFVRAASTGAPFIRGLFLDYQDAKHRLDEDEFLCGPSLLVAPIVRPAVRGRHVYLPGSRWLKVKASSEGLTGECVVPAGESFVEAGLDEIPLYLAFGKLIPMTKPTHHTFPECPSQYRLIGFTDSSAECVILLDDGETRYSTWESYPKCICSVLKRGSEWVCDVRFENAPPRPLDLEIELWDSSSAKHAISRRA